VVDLDLVFLILDTGLLGHLSLKTGVHFGRVGDQALPETDLGEGPSLLGRQVGSLVNDAHVALIVRVGQF
jgi:hypothetical protein